MAGPLDIDEYRSMDDSGDGIGGGCRSRLWADELFFRDDFHSLLSRHARESVGKLFSPVFAQLVDSSNEGGAMQWLY